MKSGFSSILQKFAALVLGRNKGIWTRTDYQPTEIEHIFLNFCLEKYKSMSLSDLVFTFNRRVSYVLWGSAEPPYWNVDKAWTGLIASDWLQVFHPHLSWERKTVCSVITSVTRILFCLSEKLPHFPERNFQMCLLELVISSHLLFLEFDFVWFMSKFLQNVLIVLLETFLVFFIFEKSFFIKRCADSSSLNGNR